MGIIFLDIDGVINNRKSMMTQDKLRTLYTMDPDCVSRLDDLISGTGAKVVVSSSWRLSRSLDEIRKCLVKYGFKNEQSVVDTTPHRISEKKIVEEATGLPCYKIAGTIHRGWEILEWLKVHEVFESFVVLDDDRPWSDWPRTTSTPAPESLAEIVSRYVHVEHELGLMDHHVAAAKIHLNTPRT